MQSMMVTQSRTGKKGGYQVIYVTEVEKEDHVVCCCLSAKSYSFLAAAGFAAMAEFGKEYYVSLITILVKLSMGKTMEEVQSRASEGDLDKIFNVYPTNLFWAMAMIHLLLFCTSSPVLFNLAARLYNIGKWCLYTMSVVITGACMYLIYYNKYYYVVEESKRVPVCQILGALNAMLVLLFSAVACIMSSITDTYSHYAEELEKEQAQEDADQLCDA